MAAIKMWGAGRLPSPMPVPCLPRNGDGGQAKRKLVPSGCGDAFDSMSRAGLPDIN